MSASEFVAWFGNELHHVVKNANHINEARDLITRAVKRLEKESPEERKEIADQLNESHRTGMVGDFRIPYDMRNEYDIIEGILATLEGLLRY